MSLTEYPVFSFANYVCTITGRETNNISPEYFGIYTGAYEIPTDPRQRLVFFRQLKQAGFYSVRLQLNWKIVSKLRGSFDWSYYDPILQDLDKVGLKALLIFIRVPDWVIPVSGENMGKEIVEEKYYPDWQNFVRESILRYGQNTGTFVKIATGFEVWNEPEQSYAGTPQNMLEMLNLAYDTIKLVDPQVMVFAPAISTQGLNTLFDGKTLTSTEFFSQYVKNGKFDVLNIHLYKNIQTSIDYVNKVKQYLDENGNIITKKAKLAVTETNDDLHPCDYINNSSDNKRVKDIINRFVCLNQYGVDYVYYFQALDFKSREECQGSDQKTKLGLFDDNFSRKNTYFPVANMIMNISGQVGFKPGDFNDDGIVDIADFAFWKVEYMAGRWTLAEFDEWKKEYLTN